MFLSFLTSKKNIASKQLVHLSTEFETEALYLYQIT